MSDESLTRHTRARRLATFAASASSVLVAAAAVGLGLPAGASVTDAESGHTLSVSSSITSADEDSRRVYIRIALDPVPHNGVWRDCGLDVVGGTATEGDDFTLSNDNRRLNRNHGWEDQAFIKILEDREVEGDETVELSASCGFASRAAQNIAPLPLAANTITLTIADDETADSNGICGRSDAVRDALVAALSAESCSEVTDSELAGLGGQLRLLDVPIANVAPDDFAGLSGVQFLTLCNNGLTSVASDALADMTSLVSLTVCDNPDLGSLPDDLIPADAAVGRLTLTNIGLTEFPKDVIPSTVTRLRLHNNSMVALPAGSFEDLSNVTILTLHENPWDPAQIAEGVLDDLISLDLQDPANNELMDLSWFSYMAS